MATIITLTDIDDDAEVFRCPLSPGAELRAFRLCTDARDSGEISVGDYSRFWTYTRIYFSARQRGFSGYEFADDPSIDDVMALFEHVEAYVLTPESLEGKVVALIADLDMTPDQTESYAMFTARLRSLIERPKKETATKTETDPTPVAQATA